MSPNSRPPLTSRIRASFDGKRTKSSSSDITSPAHANGFVTQDPESLRSAIDQAINSETFQNAIAANLARLIKPSIKTALDTIQPVVEKVYSHEILLKKTNQSVENILLRLDSVAEGGPVEPGDSDDEGDEKHERHERPLSRSTAPQNVEQFKQLLEESEARIVAKFSELPNPGKAIDGDITEVVEGIAGLQAEMGLAKQSLRSLESFTEQSTTTSSVIQAQLDQLKADIGLVIDAVGSDLGRNVKAMNDKVGKQDMALLSSHTTKLDMIASNVAALKGHSDTLEKIQSISAEVEALKGAVKTGISSSNDHFSTLGSQISTVLTGVEGHASALEGIKGTNLSPQILAALQKSNDSHASHTIALGEIKDKGLTPGSEMASVPAAESSPASAAALQALSADLASLKENIEAGLTSSNENLTSLGSKIDNVLSTIEGHKAADPSADILAAVQKSNDSHASHAEALEGIKSLNAGAAPVVDNSNIETQIGSIITTLGSHTTALEEIKSSNAISGSVAEAPVTEESKLQALETNMTTIIQTLESHTDLLNEIKDDVSAEILTSLHGIGETQANHSTTLAEIRDSDVSDEILTALHTSNDSHTSHSAALDEIHAAVRASNDSHYAHAESLDEIKALKSAAGDSALVSETVDLGGLDTKISAITSTLEDQNATLAAIKDAANASNESHTAHAVALAEIGTAAVASRDFHTSHNSSLAEIKDATAALNESHAAQAATLAEIRDAAKASNDFHSSHTASLAEIKDATAASNEAHISHTGILAELKTIQPNSAALAPETSNLDTSAIETHLNTILTTIEAQNSTLTEIKDVTANPAVLDGVRESHSLLTTHTSLLDAIKETSSHEDILANIASLKSVIEEYKTGIDSHGALVRDLHTTTQDSHSDLKAVIETLAIGGAAGASAGAVASNSEDDHSVEILAEVKAIHAIVEKSSTSLDGVGEKVTAMASQVQINHTTVTTSISRLGDEIKAEIDASGTEISTSIGTLSENVKGIDVRSLSAAVGETGKEVKGLAAMVDALGGHVEGTGLQVEELLDGVYLNERGVGQLKEFALGSGRRTPMEEAAWFKKAAPKLSDEPEREMFPVGAEDKEDDGRIELMSPIMEESPVLDMSPVQEESPVHHEEEIPDPQEEHHVHDDATPVDEPEPIQASEPIHEEEGAKEVDPHSEREPEVEAASSHLDEKPAPPPPTHIPASPHPSPVATPDISKLELEPEPEEAEEEQETESASTSAIASPLSPSFSEGSNAGKKGKKARKEKGGKKGKKDKNVPFVFDPEDDGEGEAA